MTYKSATVSNIPLSRGNQAQPANDIAATRAKPPTPPRDLSPEAKKKFRAIVKKMIAAGTYAETDIDQIGLYCETWVTWREATNQIRDDNGIHIAGNGRVTRSPFIPIAEKASVALRQMAKELGLTPASRSRIKTEKEKSKSDKWDDL